MKYSIHIIVIIQKRDIYNLKISLNGNGIYMVKQLYQKKEIDR